MKKTLLRVSALIALVLVGASTLSAQGGRVRSISGVAQVQGQDVIVHVWVVVPPGADENQAALAALRDQGARPFQGDEYSTTGLVWDQFFDSDNGNDSVTQNYNDQDDPTGGLAESALMLAQDTWTNVGSSGFVFNWGGPTDRCPSLVRECQGPQEFDGYNDVAWLPLKGNGILGVTWSGSSVDEADMALNTQFPWHVDGTDYDVRTVFLHENGHVAGLGHSEFQEAVMYAYYQGLNIDLHQDDIDGIASLYPDGGGGGGGTPPDGDSTVSVSSIGYTAEGGPNGDKHVNTTVTLEDDGANPVAGASVSILLTTDTGGSWPGTGTTGSGGAVTFSLKNAPSGCYTTTVTEVTAAGFTWDSSLDATDPGTFCK